MYTCGFRINANLVKEGSFRINAKLVKKELKLNSWMVSISLPSNRDEQSTSFVNLALDPDHYTL